MVETNYHITDIKNNFFKIELPENEYLQVKKVVFPEGVPYGEEIVFQGSNDVKVYVNNLKEINETVILKFQVSYQICQEKPSELCFAPGAKEHEVKISSTFKEVEIKENQERFLEDFSSKSSSSKYQLKGANWQLLLLLALILLFFGVFSGLSPLFSREGLGIKFIKGCIVIVLLAGAFLFCKSLDIKFSPDKYLIKPESTVAPKWIYDLEEGKEIAKKENKKLTPCVAPSVRDL